MGSFIHPDAIVPSGFQRLMR